MRRKAWRCKICSATQEYSAQDVICKNCGTDLSMGPGEVIFLDDGEQTPVAKEVSQKQTGPVKQRGPKKQIGLLPVIVAALVLIALAATITLVIWKPWAGKDGISPAPTTEPTTQPTTEPTTEPVEQALAPDFQFFAGEQAELGKTYSFSWAEQRVYRLDSKEAADAIMDEYIELIEGSYPFEQVDRYIIASEDGWNENGHCFRYQGTALLSDYSVALDDETTSKRHHLTVTQRNKNDAFYIYIVYSKELDLEFNKTRTTYGSVSPVDQVASIPEFQSFADGYASWNSGDVLTRATCINYELSSKHEAQYIMEEYKKLLVDRYPFKLLEEYTNSGDKLHEEAYTYEYTGIGTVDTFTTKAFSGADGNIKPAHVKVTFIMDKEGHVYVQIMYSNDLYPELKNVRTTYSRP